MDRGALEMADFRVSYAGCRGFQLTGTDAGSPRRQAAGRRAAVEGADVLRRQELREHGSLETLGLAAQQGGTLGRHVHHLPRQEGHGDGEGVLGGNKRRRDGGEWTRLPLLWGEQRNSLDLRCFSGCTPR